MGFLYSFSACAVILAAVLVSLPVFAQTTTVTSQVTPGHDAAITPKKITPASPTSPQGKILDSALAPKTRQTLQDAMNAASTNAPVQTAPPAK